MLIKTKIGMNGIEIEDKVQIAIERIKHFEPEEGYYVAFSGGKDSIVILDLVKRAKVKYDAHYNLTTVDSPELVRFIREKHPEVIVDKPKKTMWQLIEENGVPPTMIMRYCCTALKERGGAGRKVITGVRWKESNKRSKRMMVESCHKNQSKTYLHPIIDWADLDVWEYIKQVKLPYCELYDEGFRRLGCVMCPYAGKYGMLRDAERWPKYYENYLRAFDRMLIERERRGKQKDWATGQEVMDWWIYGNEKEKVAERQMRIYE